MRFVGKTLCLVACLVISMTAYVHGQVALFKLSYAIHQEAEQLNLKQEEFRHLKFQVDQMKAPHLLEAKMTALDLDLSLPREVRLVRLPSVPVALPDQTITQPLAGDRMMNFFGRWIKVAQAKTQR